MIRRQSIGRRRSLTVLALFVLVLGALAPRAVADEGAAATEVPHADAAGAASPRQTGWSAAALTDRGDAYAKAGSVGHAIVAYERAELLAPRDQTIVAHLNAAQAAAGLAPSPPAVYRRAAQLLSPREWSWVGLAAVWLLCLAVGAALVRPRWRRAAQRTAAAALVAGGLALAALVMIGPRSGAAIVVARGGTSLLVSPVAGAAADASVGEGAPVDVTARHEGFVRVRDGAGHEGWTSDQSVEPILPRRS